MPDSGPATGVQWGSILKTLLRTAVRALVATALGMMVVGTLVSSACFYVAYDGVWWRGAAAVLVALVVFSVAGGYLAVKRAVLAATKAGLKELQVASRVLEAVFQRMLKVRTEETFMARGGAVAQTVERLPLAQAETLLKNTVDQLLDVPEAGGGVGGWLRRRLQETLLRKVEAITLTRFREDGVATGGVDLALAQQVLADEVDVRLLKRVDALLLKLTVLLALGACTLSLLGAVMLKRFS